MSWTVSLQQYHQRIVMVSGEDLKGRGKFLIFHAHAQKRFLPIDRSMFIIALLFTPRARTHCHLRTRTAPHHTHTHTTPCTPDPEPVWSYLYIFTHFLHCVLLREPVPNRACSFSFELESRRWDGTGISLMATIVSNPKNAFLSAHRLCFHCAHKGETYLLQNDLQ